MFRISLYCTIVVPVIIYAGMLIYKNAQDRKELPFDAPDPQGETSRTGDDEADERPDPSSAEK